jgi:hypothetical protein
MTVRSGLVTESEWRGESGVPYPDSGEAKIWYTAPEDLPSVTRLTPQIPADYTWLVAANSHGVAERRFTIMGPS